MTIIIGEGQILGEKKKIVRGEGSRREERQEQERMKEEKWAAEKRG